MPPTRGAMPSSRAQEPGNHQKQDTTHACLADNLWEQLQARQTGNPGQQGSARQALKQEEEPGRLGYYQEHGPRRFGDQEKRQPTLEERFWQFTPDVPESEDSDDSAEERELVSCPLQIFKKVQASVKCSVDGVFAYAS